MPKQHSQDLPFSPEADLDELVHQAESRYPVHFETVTIGSTALQILQIRDMEAYIEDLASRTSFGQELSLPFWAKIWPTSLLLGHILEAKYPVADLDVLEIGSGVGLCGLVAAAKGARVTLSDTHPDALLFGRINALKNGLQDRVRVACVDFTTDRLQERFQRIIGSEVLYKEAVYTHVVDFLAHHLISGPGAEVLLAKSHHFKATTFYQRVTQVFEVQERSLGYKEQNPASGTPERHVCHILRLRPLPHV